MPADRFSQGPPREYSPPTHPIDKCRKHLYMSILSEIQTVCSLPGCTVGTLCRLGRSGTSPYSRPPAAPDHMELALRRRVRKRDDPPRLRRARRPPGRRASGALIQRFWRGNRRAIHQQLFHLLQNFELHPLLKTALTNPPTKCMLCSRHRVHASKQLTRQRSRASEVGCRTVGSNPNEFKHSVADGISFCNLRVLHASSTALSEVLFRRRAGDGVFKSISWKR